MQIKVKLNYDKLKKVVQEMSKKYSVKVGLLAEQGGSDEVSENLDMAGLGAVHEFGCDIKITKKMAAYIALTAKELGLPKLQSKGDGYIHIPARSFLQMPLTRKNAILAKLKERFGSVSIEEIKEYVLSTNDLYSLAVVIGAAAVDVIKDAFKTSGWGEWKPDSPYTIAAKKSAMPLRDLGELERRITSEVIEK